MRTLNLGILAHVDAGKTTLTERLLYAAGVIDEIGSVDDGSTQTDSLALERQRGITIKSAVVSFVIDDVTVNLIDTPGHPDFIAEVERVLSVLDGAVLVISAVEGVQAQTRVLMRTLQRLHIPTLIFVNKIDRGGARDARVLRETAETLTPAIIAMGSARHLGTRGAEFTPYGATDVAFTARLADLLADHDDALLAAYVDDETTVSYRRLRDELAAQTKQALVHPVFFGSAITGAGVDALIAGIAELLPAAEGDVDGPVSGTVFKVERGPAGERIAYVRMFSGTVRTRDRMQVRGDDERKITAISVFDRGSAVRHPAVAAGQIGKLWGLGDVQIGDAIGTSRTTSEGNHFAPPTLETVVVPRRPADKGALRVALDQLAEQDPLINLRQDDVRQELFVSLYGEVQKEVIQETLANDFDIDVEFRETTTICIERPIGTGAAVETIGKAPNPFLATVGLRIDPAPIDSGVEFRLEVELGSIPLSFHKAVEDTVQTNAAPRHLRMAGHRLHRHHDALRLLAAAGERGRGLPQSDTAGPDERAEAGRHQGVRADPPLPPRGPDRHARIDLAGTGTAARRSTNTGDAGRVVHAGGRDSDSSRSRTPATATGVDARRRRARVRLRLLPTGPRHDPDPPADRPQPAQPQGLPAARPL